MNKKLMCGLSFVAGALVASVTTFVIVKGKYEEIANEEIKSVQDAYARKSKELADKNAAEKAKIAMPFTTIGTYNYSINAANTGTEATSGYVDLTPGSFEEETVVSNVFDSNPVLEKVTPKTGNKPYKIAANQYGEHDDYSINCLYYFPQENIICDDNYEPIDSPDHVIGYENLDFDDSDSAYVRNDELQADYEIIIEERSYADIHND